MSRMPRQPDRSEIGRWNRHGRRHVVHVRRTAGLPLLGALLDCATCGWRQRALLPGPRAEEHLAEAHQATVDPAASRRDGFPAR
ncbi:hypothetical protein ACFOOM_01505 [Streptomyces echinoruber]|uniref:Uncharacterized protein n=1 Tax=Streptomyces echinoruber TaxID=68898 RepID=A0A918QVC1_9ACTN|nr:hypothetical protein [Streptomyces echinoruber]GGZ72450.1 hypothetical protein GCM10010389_07280 [Streptomyces echinoruber]